MPRSVDEAIDDINAIADMLRGKAQIAAALAEVERIELEGPAAAKPLALVALIDAYSRGGEKEKAYVPFSHLISLYDTEPEWFDSEDRHYLFWYFKWVMDALPCFPNVPLAQLHSTMDDMQRRYAQEGFSMDAPIQARFNLARRLGVANCQELYDQWLQQRRDELSDCRLCAAGQRIEYLAESGRPDDALGLMRQTFTQRSMPKECSDEPASIYSWAQFAFLDNSTKVDTQRAAQAHHRSRVLWDPTHGLAVTTGRYPLQERAFELAGARGRCVEFLARTGNEHAAVALLASNKHFLQQASTPLDRLEFLTHVGAGLRVMVDDLGLGAREIYSGVPGSGTLETLWKWVRDQAEDLAQAFDKRNGNTHQSDVMHARWRLEAYDTPVDLVVPLPEPAVMQAAEPTKVDTGEIAFAPVFAQAESLARRGDSQAAIGAYLKGADDFEAAGQLVEAGFARAEAGHLAMELDALDDARANLTRANSLLRVADIPLVFLAPVANSLSDCLARLGEPDLADQVISPLISRLDELLENWQSAAAPDVAKAQKDDLSWARISLDSRRAHNLVLAGKPEAGAELAQKTAEQYGQLGLVRQSSEEFLFAGQTWLSIDQTRARWCLESAVEGFKLAVQELEMKGAAKLLASLS